MPIPGPELDRYLSDQLRQLQLESRQLLERGPQIERILQQTVAERSEILNQLAQLDLPELSGDAMTRVPPAARQQVQDVLRQQQQETTELHRQLIENDTDRDTAEQQLHATTEALNDKVRERDALLPTWQAALEADPEFVRRNQLWDQARTRLARTERRLQDLQAESRDKLPSYQQSDLFQYLWNRRYGQPDYVGWGFSRAGDRWVARLIDYRNARTSYEFLTRTPQIVADEVTRQQQTVQELAVARDQQQKRIADQVGMTVILEAGQQLGAQREAQLALVARLAQQDTALRAAISDAEDRRGRFYRQALDRYRQYLEQTSTARLADQASQTPDRRDDQLVEQIRELDAQAGDCQRQLQELRTQRQSTQQQLSVAESIVQRFRQLEFDSDRCQFAESLSLPALFAQVLAGQLGVNTFWQQVSAAVEFRPMIPPPPRGPVIHSDSGSYSGGIFPAVLEAASHPAVWDAVIRTAGTVIDAAARQSQSRGGSWSSGSSGSWSAGSAGDWSGGGSSGAAPSGGGSSAPTKPYFTKGEGF